MKPPFSAAINAWRIRRSLDIDGRERLEKLRIRLDHMAARPYFIERAPLALARFVALDLETTGPNMLQDVIISIGAVAISVAGAGVSAVNADAETLVAKRVRRGGIGSRAFQLGDVDVDARVEEEVLQIREAAHVRQSEALPAIRDRPHVPLTA